jgi:NAD(P)-dependent dehydrogenase (short-subunit alcohol dehydrogenase family)
MYLSLNLTDTHILIAGGTGSIGSSTVTALLAAGSRVTCLDIRAPHLHTDSSTFQFISCDIYSENSVEAAFSHASEKFGPVACCIARASLDLSVLPPHESLADMDVEQWRRTHQINFEDTFLTARGWLRQIRESAASSKAEEKRIDNVRLIIIGARVDILGREERGLCFW